MAGRVTKSDGFAERAKTSAKGRSKFRFRCSDKIGTISTARRVTAPNRATITWMTARRSLRTAHRVISPAMPTKGALKSASC